MLLFWFLIPFLAGLGLGVFAMLGGIETRRSIQAAIDRFGREPVLGRVRVSVPVLANALAAFGGAGYLFARARPDAPWLALALALGASVAAAVATALIIKRWAVPSALREPEDPRYVLQGQVARVRQAIGGERLGQISYELNGKVVLADARSIDGSVIPADADVVIERVEDDVVYVEAWTVVEQRL